MQVFVAYNKYLIDSVQPEEEYGSWSEHWDFNPESVQLTKPHFSRGSFESFTLSDDVVVGQRVYVLWMTYNTGDSFGSGIGHGEILWAFTDEDYANNALHDCLRQDKVEASSFEFVTEDGTNVKLSNPAWGYFENLTSMEVSEFVVKP